MGSRLGRPKVEKSDRELRGRMVDIQNVIDELNSNRQDVSLEPAAYVDPKPIKSNLERFWLIGPISSRFWGCGDLNRNIRTRDPSLLHIDGNGKQCALGSVILVHLLELKEELRNRIQPSVLELAAVPLEQSFKDLAYACLIRLSQAERGEVYKKVEAIST